MRNAWYVTDARVESTATNSLSLHHYSRESVAPWPNVRYTKFLQWHFFVSIWIRGQCVGCLATLWRQGGANARWIYILLKLISGWYFTHVTNKLANNDDSQSTHIIYKKKQKNEISWKMIHFSGINWFHHHHHHYHFFLSFLPTTNFDGFLVQFYFYFFGGPLCHYAPIVCWLVFTRIRFVDLWNVDTVIVCWHSAHNHIVRHHCTRTHHVNVVRFNCLTFLVYFSLW